MVKKFFSSLFRFYVDLPLVVFFLLLVVIFRAAIFDELLAPLAKLLTQTTKDSVLTNLSLGVLSNIITAVLLAVLGLFFFRLLMRARLSGDYKAVELSADNTATDWGTVRILFAPLALDLNGVPVKLQLRNGDVLLEGKGLIVDNRTLVGHYTETGKPERRRCGSFFFQLDGGGQAWTGQFLHISPETSEPTVGKAKWSRA
jgi:hypothetical protein